MIVQRGEIYFVNLNPVQANKLDSVQSWCFR